MVKSPFFSIIISTRDRPELFLQALNSVAQQSCTDREIVVVIDGSSDENLSKYRAFVTQFPEIGFLELPHRPNGHGQSYAMNYGVQHSSGRYLCFLDDDDYWADGNYLSRVRDSVVASSTPVELHYSNQRAIFSSGAEQSIPVWLEDLIPRVQTQTKHIAESYFVDMEFLLSSAGFAHLNCSIFERAFYTSIGGMDETIRYENDRDVYLRALDKAKTILFSSHYISVHNIPDREKRTNMSTIGSDIDKKLFQIRVYDKGISLSQNARMVGFCSKSKIYELKHATRILAQEGRYRSAAHFAKSALVSGFNLRWLAYTSYLAIMSALRSNCAHDNGTP
jgi:glycosyltransferase involved in cell wall biosynthesis